MWTVTTTVYGKGSISPSGTVYVGEGENQTFTIIHDFGYHIDEVLIDGINDEEAVISGEYTFINVTDNHTIEVAFAQTFWTITATAGANGSITPSGEISLIEGENQTFIITSNSGDYIDEVLIDGINDEGAVNSGEYTFINVTENHTIEVAFAQIMWTVTATVYGKGSISPSGIVYVGEGENQTFTITSNSGYHISKILIDGVSDEASIETGEYTFINVTENHTIDVIFIITSSCESLEDIIVGISQLPNMQIPVNTAYSYSYVQQIYDAAEFTGREGQDIMAISYEYIYGVPNPKNPVTIYMGHTDKTVFSGTSDWVSFSELTEVYSGAVIFDNSQKWVTINLDIPFTYEGGNLVVAVLNNHGSSSTGANNTFYTHSVGVYKTIHYRIDGATPINPATPPSATARLDYRSNTNFTFCNEFAVVYTIMATAGANGSINPAGEISVEEGENQTFTITPDSGYHIYEVLIDGTNNPAAVAAGEYTFTNVTDNHTIEVTFAQTFWTVTATAGANGTIEPSGDISVAEGENQTFTFIPDSNYLILQVLIDGINDDDAKLAGEYTFENVTTNHTVSVSFIHEGIDFYTITATASAGGSIEPSGAILVIEGENQTFTIASDSGYYIDEVLIDGVNDEEAVETGEYTFINITENHTIAVSFTQTMWIITATAGANGIIDPTGDISVAEGENQIFTITSNSGYHIDEVLIDGVNDEEAVNSGEYTFINVTENHTIEVSFIPEGIDFYTITATAGANGTITPSGAISVAEGANQTFTITPNAGYHIEYVLIDGTNNPAAVIAGTYTFTNVTENHTIVKIGRAHV
jgi:hypothetical protein